MLFDENRKMGMVFGGGKQKEVRFGGGDSESCFENSAIRDPIVRFTAWLISGCHFSAHRCRLVVTCIGQGYRLYSKNDRTRASLCMHQAIWWG